MTQSTDIIAELMRKMTSLENTVLSQNERLSQLESKGNAAIHSLEVAQETRTESQSQRRKAMSEGDLRVDLEKQYGHTAWAKKFIDGMLQLVGRNRKVNN